MIAYLGDRAIFAVEFVTDSDQIVLQGGSTLVVPDSCARRFSITQLSIGWFGQWFVDRSHGQFAELAIL